MRTTIQQLAEFLTACRGNWRNACFISCGVCKCHSPCSGYLMSADAGGKPVLISAAEYERLAGQRIDPSECRENFPAAPLRIFMRYISTGACQTMKAAVYRCSLFFLLSNT